MILLSFTSAAKYIIGLMLVMLGFIPYDALETKSSVMKTPEPDSVWIESAENELEQEVYHFEYASDKLFFTLPDSTQTTVLAGSDSIHILLVETTKNVSGLQCIVH